MGGPGYTRRYPQDFPGFPKVSLDIPKVFVYIGNPLGRLVETLERLFRSPGKTWGSLMVYPEIPTGFLMFPQVSLVHPQSLPKSMQDLLKSLPNLPRATPRCPKGLLVVSKICSWLVCWWNVTLFLLNSAQLSK